MAINVNQLTEQLRMMPDQALQRMAMMYKNDPYIFPMVISEDMARKKMRQAAQAQTAQPQPKVVDQALMSMGEQPQPMMPQASPGIAALQAPNMENMADGGIAGSSDMDYINHSEPVVRMSGGGVPGYAAGRRVRDFESLIRSEAERQGVDPDIALRMFMTETGGVEDATTAVSPKGATGIGQLMVPAAKEMGLSPEERKDPEKNIRASVGYLKKQLDKYGSYDKALAAYNYGPTALDQHLAKNKGELNVLGLPKETANYLNKILPMGEAVAETKAKQTAAGQIPGQAPGVTAPAAEQEGFFSRLGSGLGMSEETKRNIGNILMAPTPLAPAAGIPKAAGQSGIMSGLAGLAERIRGPQVGRVTPAQITEMQSAAQAAQAARAAEEATEAARMAGALPGEAQAVAQSAEAAQTAARAAQMPSKAERLQSASLLREGQEAARIGQMASGAQQAKQATALSTMLGDAKTPKAAGDKYGPSLGYDWAESVPMDTKKDIIKDAKQTADPETKKQAKKEGWTNDDWLALGFGLLANKSPYLSEALGTAGLGVLAARREREKAAREEAKELSEATYRERLGREAEARGAYYTEGTKGATAAEQAALRAISEWQKAQPLAAQQMPDFAAKRETQYRAYLKEAYERLGLKMPEGLTSGTAATGQRVIDFSSIR